MVRLKVLIIVLPLMCLLGCAKGPKPFFAKESDTLNKSACLKRGAKPFYVDGRWI